MLGKTPMSTATRCLKVGPVTCPAHGTAALITSGRRRKILYTPNANYCGPDSFTYKANDGDLDSNVATVSIDVTSVNDAPVAVDDERYNGRGHALRRSACWATTPTSTATAGVRGRLIT